MPYRRSSSARYRRRSRRFRSRSARYTTMGSVAHLAKQAAKGVWYLKGLVNSEKFKHDASATIAADDAGALVHITGISQGDGEGSRTGNSIFVRNVSMKTIVSFPSGATYNTALCRVSLIMDTQQIADSAPGFAGSNGVYEANGPLTFLNTQTVGRFKVLYSRTFVINTASRPTAILSMNKAMRHHVRYNAGTTGDVQKGGLYLCFVSDVTSNPPLFNHNFRVSYHDN